MKTFPAKPVSDSFSDNRKAKTATRKLMGIVALVIAFATCGAVAQAQQPTKIPRLGILELASRSASAEGHEALQQGSASLAISKGKT